PPASNAVSRTAGAIAAPAVVLPGCTVKASRVAAATVMVKGALVAPASPVAPAARVEPLPLWSTARFEKVATPPTAATVVVPDKVPPTGLAPIATVTAPLKPGTVFPRASRAVTCTAGVMAAPAVVLLGCVVKASWAADPGVTAKAALVVPERLPAVADSV